MRIKLVIVLLAGLTGGAIYYAIRSESATPIAATGTATSNESNPAAAGSNADTNDSTKLTICSFNIQFLGHFKKRDNAALASILTDYDIVLVQELVAPPDDGTYPDGETYTEDAEADAFFDEMESLGFDWTLSSEDTGTGDEIHKANTATEWWVAFYKRGRVEPATDIPSGFLADDRSNHDDYERVSYAFAFRTAGGNLDFVLISVHLKPGASQEARRQQELNAITDWIDAHDQAEHDFIIVGDMNIEPNELNLVPAGFVSLNDELGPTNTNLNGPKPYDHVLYNPTTTTEIDGAFDFQVVDLIEAMRPHWTSTDPYPGDPYNHNAFRQLYSDHHPVVFRLDVGVDDD